VTELRFADYHGGYSTRFADWYFHDEAPAPRILELGSYIIPAYAGMILQEQGMTVEKWWTEKDPVLGLRRGDELWDWLNNGKVMRKDVHARSVLDLEPGDVNGVIDNFRASTWERWGVDPAEQAARLGVPWVSMRADVGERSFDAIAQARAWMEHGPYVPFYVGDTAGGLWAAFKLLAARGRPGHHPIYQATCLAKLVEGELMVDEPRVGMPPWDEPGTYGADGDGVRVEYRDEVLLEPVRDRAWKLEHLRHNGGRLVV